MVETRNVLETWTQTGGWQVTAGGHLVAQAEWTYEMDPLAPTAREILDQWSHLIKDLEV